MNEHPHHKRWYVLASGPSLQPDEIEAVRLEHEAGRGCVVAVNLTIFDAPFADACYAWDTRWWQTYHKKVPPHCLRLSANPRLSKYGVESLRRHRDESGLSDLGVSGNNSGHHAVNYAYLRGAKEVIVIGLDCCHHNGQAHHHPDYPEPFTNAKNPQNWLQPARDLADALKRKGVRIINAGRYAVDMGMERMSLTEFLADA